MSRKTVAIVVCVVLAVLFLPRYLLIRAHSRIALRHQHIAQAICDFRARNGVLPESLDELVPDHLPALPAGSRGMYHSGTLAIHSGLPHTYVGYSFGRDEGWRTEGDFSLGPLPVPSVTPSVTPVTGDEYARARLATYDRRIAASPKETRHRTSKIAYLLSLKRSEEARDECRSAATALPDWWRAQAGLAELAPPAESAAAEARFVSWVDAHPGFVHYCRLSFFYRDRGRTKDALAALKRAAAHPLENVKDEEWVPSAYAFNAAAFACREKEPQLALAITDSWAAVRGVYASSRPDSNLPAFRAAAGLALGRFAEARANADVVLATSREQAIWAKNLDRLDEAIRREDRTFVYDPGPWCDHSELRLFPDRE